MLLMAMSVSMSHFAGQTKAYCHHDGWVILSDSAKEQFVGSGYGGAKIQLSLEDIRELCVVKPTNEEQLQIEIYIDAQLIKFTKLIERAEHQILLLRERRSALISAAVTGKIDVRNCDSRPKGEK